MSENKTVRLGDPQKSTVMGQEEREEVEPVRLRVLAPTTAGGILARAAMCHERRVDTTVIARTRDVEWDHSPWPMVGGELLVSIPAIVLGGGLWCLGPNANVDCKPGNGDSGGQVLGASLAGMGTAFLLGALIDTVAIGLFDGTGYKVERKEYAVPVDLGVVPCQIVPVAGRVGEVAQDGKAHNFMTDVHGRFVARLRGGQAYLEMDGEQVWYEVPGTLARSSL